MKSSFRSIAIILARGGSKRIPSKNIRNLGGRPLVCYTLDAAVKSLCFDKVILSSDSAEILAIANEYGGDVVPLGRAAILAQDDTPSTDVVVSILNQLTKYGDEYDIVSMLQPTSPFRKAEHIQAAMDLLSYPSDGQSPDGVVSVTPYSTPPQWAFHIQDGLLSADESSPLLQGKCRFQEQEVFYCPNGAIYISLCQHFMRTQSFYNGKIAAYVMPDMPDIDTELDFAFADFLMRNTRFIPDWKMPGNG